MNNSIGTFPKETGWIKKFRIHQGWWRTFVLVEEEGQYWDEKSKEVKKVCNRINNGEKTKKNFLSDEIAATVKESLLINKKTQSGRIEEDRLYNNLLSSQPLAFNFFGFFNQNSELALSFIKDFRSDITEIESVVFEYAPPSTKDRSAFDFGFFVSAGVKKGFIGFECKYTDAFSFKRSGSTANYGGHGDKNYSFYYPVWEQNRDRFTCDYFDYVDSKHYNQLFRNDLLAVQMKPNLDFVITGLFCHHDDSETIKAGLEYKKLIGNGKNDFILLTYADYFERIQKLNLSWKQRELVMMLWARYCGLGLSKNYI